MMEMNTEDYDDDDDSSPSKQPKKIFPRIGIDRPLVGGTPAFFARSGKMGNMTGEAGLQQLHLVTIADIKLTSMVS